MENINQSIACTVVSCRHHHDQKNYCTLNAIQVGTHEPDPSVCECTDCESFARK